VALGAVVTLAMIIASAWVLDWFHVRIVMSDLFGPGDLTASLSPDANVSIDLHSMHSCAPGTGVCASQSLSTIKGIYPSLALATLWLSQLFAVSVLLQAVISLSGNQPSARMARGAYLLGVTIFLIGGSAGYLFSPDTQTIAGVHVEVDRTWGPALMLLAVFAGWWTVYSTQGSGVHDDAEYKPIKVEKTKRGAPAATHADDDEPDTPPIVDAPKREQRPKQILTPGGTQPIPKPAGAPRLPSSLPLEDPIGELELGASGAGIKIEDPKSMYHSPEVVFDPNTPSIPLAEEPRGKTPSTPPLEARTKSATIPPIVRNKAPSVQPILERPTVPTIPPPVQSAAESGLSMRTKRPSSSPPLTEGGVVVRMRPPTNPPVAADAPRKGTPGQGVVIRAKPPTAPPLLEGPRRGTPGSGVPAMSRSKTPGSVSQVSTPAEAEVAPPAALAGKLRYATLTATVSHVGIEARREDGFVRTVMWPDVVGIVARRLPPEDPFDGVTFVDVVSTAGATLRILPWTRLSGDRIEGDGTERARAFVQLCAARCPGAKLDAATRTFLGSHGQAAQLPDEPTLAAHDRRLS